MYIIIIIILMYITGYK